MFYSEQMDNFLRFGDVVRGYIAAFPRIKQPFLSMERVYDSCSIDVGMPQFSVVITPCCSIGDCMVCLTPLIKLRSSFLKNPYFVEDFTIINREIEPEKCFAPEEWEKMEWETKQVTIAAHKPYALLNLFVYEENDLWPKYRLKKMDLKYYMIDFRNVNTVRCDMIKRAEEIGPSETPILESKCFQLSETTREELRNKMAYYYARRPEEEEIWIST